MRFLDVFLFFSLCALPVLLHGQDQLNLYVWNRAGVAVYAEPSTSVALDTLRYGTALRVIEEGEEVIESLLAFPTDSVFLAYAFFSKWLLIELDNGHRAHVLDTYLLPYPPNTSEELSDYFGQLSEVIDERSFGQTDQFCSQTSYAYQSGIRYTYTDRGPCESCGQSITQILLPGWTLQQAFVFLTNFNSEIWDMDGRPVENYLDEVTFTVLKDSCPARMEWFFAYDQVTLTETENGVEILIDTVL